MPADSINKKRHFNISRKTFIQLSALTGAAALVSRFIRHPVLGAVLSAQESGEGVISERLIATSCMNCATRCATRVRVVNGKAVKVTGNPLSRVSEGENCPRAHIGLQVLYNPERITSPLKRTNQAKGKGIDPQWASISWTEALSEIGTRLKSLRANGQPHQLLLLKGLNANSDEDIIRRFADAYGTPNVISADSLENEADKAGEWMADGHYTQSAYDLANTNYILSFGASILESYKPLARGLRMWGKIRRERPNRAKIVVIDPRYSITAAKSDQWVPINPGTDAALAMAVAYVILSEGLYDAAFINNWTTGFAEYKSFVVKNYQPEDAARITGIPADTIKQIAREFAATRPAIAWRGRGATSWPNGAYAGYAIFCLNALVGSIDVPGGVTYQESPQYTAMPELIEDDTARAGKAQPRIDLSKTASFPAAEVVTNQVADSILDGRPYPVQLAIGFNSNLNMSAPGTSRWDEALQKVPFYVHVAPLVSEMAEYADIVLPSTTFLEQWGYDQSPPGSGFAEVKLKQPVVEPLGETKGITDIIFQVAGMMGGTVAQAFNGLGGNAEGFVEYRTKELLSRHQLQNDGVWLGKAYEYYKYDTIFKTPSQKFEFRSGNLEGLLKDTGKSVDELALLPHYKEAEFFGESGSYPLNLVTYQPVLNVENGSQNYPWAQEVYLVQHGRGWTNFAEINGHTAHTLGIKDGDRVWVESPFGKLKTRARVFEGIHPHVIAIATGQGHTATGQWQQDIGVNPNEIIGVDYDRLCGQSAFFNTRVRIYKA